jgi:hypothetical protein
MTRHRAYGSNDTEAPSDGGLGWEPFARLSCLCAETIRGVIGIRMPEIRKKLLFHRAGRSLPAFLMGFGVVTVILWVTILGWLLFEAVLWIF